MQSAVKQPKSQEDNLYNTVQYNRPISIYPEIHTWLMGRQGNKTKELYYSLTNLRINYFVLFHSLMYNCADRENLECMRTWAWTKSSIFLSVSSNSCQKILGLSYTGLHQSANTADRVNNKHMDEDLIIHFSYQAPVTAVRKQADLTPVYSIHEEKSRGS